MHQLPWPGTKLPFLHMQPFSNNFISIAFKPRFALSIKPQYWFNHSLSSKCIAWLWRNTRSPFCSQVLLEKMFKPRFNREHASSSPLLTSCVWAHRLSARVSGEKCKDLAKILWKRLLSFTSLGTVAAAEEPPSPWLKVNIYGLWPGQGCPLLSGATAHGQRQNPEQMELFLFPWLCF